MLFVAKGVDVALYTMLYNFEYDEYWDKSAVGVKVGYRFTDSFSTALRFERAGIMDGITVTLGYHF